MRLLLDTHAFLWAIEEPRKLSPVARRRIESGSTRVFVSLATLWELAIKESLGRLQSRRPLDVLVEDALALHRFEQLDVRLPHVRRLTALPRLHGDPFDRMLVAQAIEERCVLVTRDRVVQGYPVEHLW